MKIKEFDNVNAKILIDKLDLEEYNYSDKTKGYEDFRFLLDFDFKFASNSFIIAYDEKHLYGIIRLIETTYKNKKIKGISFIDVNKHFKNQGISKKLIKYFDEITPQNIILSSKPCEEGKTYKMDKVLKSITNKKVVFV